MAFDDLRSFVEACKAIGPRHEILDADWNLEIGTLAETAAELVAEPPLLIFDRIQGYPPGFRVASLVLTT